MITKKMIATLQAIKEKEEKNGAALTTDIETYQHRTTLYRTLDKLVNLQAVNRQEAPKTKRVKNTYTITDFGEKLIEQSKKADIIK